MHHHSLKTIIKKEIKIYKHYYFRHKLPEKQVWVLAEIAAFALTSLTTESKKFWPWDNSGYYYNHNYPQIVELQKKMKPLFLKRKNFAEYIVKGIELIKNTKSLEI